MDIEVWVGIGILVFVYILIAFDIINRTVAALLGSLMVGAAAYFYHFATADDLIESVDFETIVLLMSMMIIVGILGRTGFFQFVAYRTAKAAGGDPWKILVSMTVLTAALSALLDNVTTILLVIPMTIELTFAMGVDPKPFILSEIFASNIGGTATLIGDPPNIMIGSKAHLNFTDFIVNLGPVVLIDLLVMLTIVYFMYGKNLRGAHILGEEDFKRMEKEYRIEDVELYRKAISILLLTITLFVVGEFFGFPPVVAAFLGAVLLLLLSGEDIEKALNYVEWPTLLFFAGLFVVVGGVEYMGVLELIAQTILTHSQGHLVLTIVAIVWISALTSAIIDNIPFTATMIPIVFAIANNMGISPEPLFWALSLGACLGGNGTLVGASANVVGVNVAERSGIYIDFKTFFKNGFLITLITVGIATIYILVRYVWM